MPTDQPPQVTVKTELGSSYKRLPSFRTPRDLKLSQFRDIPSTNSAGEGRTKKVFVPNLNVHRKRTEDRDESRPGDAESLNNSRDSSRDRGRGTGERGRGRGRGRKSREFIQQTGGVFSQGLAPSMKPTWHGKSYDSGSTTGLPKPKLKLNENVKVDKEEEEEVMKELLRDDFIDDPDIEADLDHAPVELPLQDVCKWEHIKDEKPFSSLTYHNSCTDGFMNGVKVKPDPECMDPSEANGVADKPVDVQSMRPLTLAQLLSVSQEKNFLFFQIPHRIPKLRMNVNPSMSSQKRTGERHGEEEESETSVLRTLPQGRVGTLQIRKSGRAVLVLGDVKLNVEPGTQSAFKQDLVSVNLENSTKSGNMINMGKITTRILVTPDWKHLLNNVK
uniref:DNA-directed RNA polymerase III subunit RPC4 n=1 Tax=Lygus hesperus TaxID=30085 RepID=A0A0A9XBA3_LYGHE